MVRVQSRDDVAAAGAVRFVMGLVALELVSLGVALWMTSLPWFLDHDAYQLIKVDGYAQRSRRKDCEIVIGGDSTALADFVPAVIEARTGLKTCNDAEIRAVDDLMGTHYAIDEYLARNRRPRFLVTGWTPSDLNLEHERMDFPSPEGYEYAMQYARGPWLWKGMLRHPQTALVFLTWAERSVLTDTELRLTGAHSQGWSVDERARREAAGGVWRSDDESQTKCRVYFRQGGSGQADRDRASVAAFRRHYEALGMKVLVLVTPIADCSPHLAADLKETAGVADNALEALPVQEFGDIMDIHLSSAAADRYSNRVSDRLLELMRQDAARGGEEPASQ